MEKREKKQIKKRAILIDSPFARDYLKGYHETITENRYVDYKSYPFFTVMHIYDNKVSYITLTENSKIGVIIEDQNIYQMHKSLFEFTWHNAKKIDQLDPLSNAQ